jgi:DNA helicase HerA-like ATPase
LCVGATGTGKSATLKLELRTLGASSPPWAILVDPDNEYGSEIVSTLTVSSLAEITRLSIAGEVSRGWYRFVPSDDRRLAVRQFSFLCALAWTWATRLRRETLLLVDELAEFTAANEAPAAWRRLVKRGRKQGISVLAASQRPAEIDKTIFSNASRIRVYRLGYDADQAAAAAALGVQRAQVAALQGHDFLERNALAGGGLTAGSLHFAP